MNVRHLNERLLAGGEVPLSWFPHLEHLANQSVAFEIDFGLPVLPDEPGVLSIRGPRQYGKSTWLEQQLRDSALRGGPGSAFYLNGDHIADAADLVVELETLDAMFRRDAPHRRLFVDEITAVDGWEGAGRSGGAARRPSPSWRR